MFSYKTCWIRGNKILLFPFLLHWSRNGSFDINSYMENLYSNSTYLGSIINKKETEDASVKFSLTFEIIISLEFKFSNKFKLQNIGKLLFLWLFDLSLLVISSSLRYNFVTRKILDRKSNKTTSLFFSINFLLTIPTYGEMIRINSLYYHYHFTNPRSTKVSFHSPSLRFLKLFPISGANYRSYSISKSFLSYIKENRCALPWQK